jgi:hypothetical protein
VPSYLKSSIKSKGYEKHLTLTLEEAIGMLDSTHHVIMVTISAKLFLKCFSGLKVMEQTLNVDFLTLDLKM